MGMTRVPGMLMLGAAGRNAGKTELACAIIRKFSHSREITGVKVTTIRERGGACPRGGRGCGVCSSLDDDYCITDETGVPAGKDTSRLLAAGANRVLWLRVLKEHLDKGLKALLERIGPGSVTVCESNSLRVAAEPDLFLMVKDKGPQEFKLSAKAVMAYVDRVVHSDGAEFDISLDDISINNGPWALRRDATAIVLAGGDSSRMGLDKGLLPVGGKPMIEHVLEQVRPHFREVLVSANDANEYAFLGERVVADEVPGRGPLMGIVSALDASTYDLAFVVACDMPEIDVGLMRRMFRETEGYDGVVPVGRGSLPEPLFAIYRKSVVPAAREALASGKRRVNEIFRRHRIKFIEPEGLVPVRNVNTMAEYRKFRKERRDAV